MGFLLIGVCGVPPRGLSQKKKPPFIPPRKKYFFPKIITFYIIFVNQ